MIKNSKKIRGGELLAKALVEKGIEDVFTLAGGFCNPALEGFMNLQTNVVNCPHEQIAGHLADGLTRIKRKPAVSGSRQAIGRHRFLLRRQCAPPDLRRHVAPVPVACRLPRLVRGPTAEQSSPHP